MGRFRKNDEPAAVNGEAGVEESPIVRHVNGEPIPDHLLHLIPFDSTDEGLAERAARPRARVEFVTDEHQKKLDEVRDFKLANIETWESPDPMGELKDRYLEPGQRGRFLSPAKCQRDGLRGWEPVKDAKGDPVRLGNLFLAQMPEAKAEARREFFEEKGKVALEQVRNSFVEMRDSALRDAKVSRRGKRSDPDDLSTGLSPDDPRAPVENVLR